MSPISILGASCFHGRFFAVAEFLESLACFFFQKDFLDEKIARWTIFISVVLIVASGFLNQKELLWIKPFAGATLAIIASISVGFLIGYLFGFDPNEKETTVLAKFVKIALVLAAGASLASIGPAIEFTREYFPTIANDLELNSGTLLFLFPTLCIPAFLIGYLWRIHELGESTDLYGDLKKLKSPESVMKFILEKPKEHDKLLDKYENMKDIIVQRYGGEISGLVSAMNFYRKREYRSVLEALEGYPLSEHDRGQINLLIGASLMQLGKYDDALRYLRQIENIEEFTPGIERLLAYTFMGMGELNEASRYFSRYLSVRPNDKDAAKRQLEVLKLRYELAHDEEKESIFEDAGEFVMKLIENGLLTKEEVEEIWNNLMEED